MWIKNKDNPNILVNLDKIAIIQKTNTAINFKTHDSAYLSWHIRVYKINDIYNEIIKCINLFGNTHYVYDIDSDAVGDTVGDAVNDTETLTEL